MAEVPLWVDMTQKDGQRCWINSLHSTRYINVIFKGHMVLFKNKEIIVKEK